MIKKFENQNSKNLSRKFLSLMIPEFAFLLYNVTWYELIDEKYISGL